MKTIQVLKPKFRIQETLSEIEDCLNRGWTGIGYKTDEFEREWSRYTGHKNSLFLNSATSALHLAIKIFKDREGWSDGDEVISTSLTFVSTNHVILYENLTPVFADVDHSLCMDPSSVEKMIGPRTRAVIYVGIGGNAQNYQPIRELCKKYNLKFILDAAHMSGSRWKDNGEHVGLDSDCACYSYQAVKNLPTSDAGMLCFKDDQSDQIARKMSWLGIDKSTYDRYTESSYKWKYDVPLIGYKYNGNSINAAIALVSLRYLDQDNAYRRYLSDIYSDELAGIEEITVVKHSADINSSRHLFQILVKNRDKLMDELAANAIYAGVHYTPNHTYQPYENFKQDVKNCEYFSPLIMSLPLHLELDEYDIKRVVESLKSGIHKLGC